MLSEKPDRQTDTDTQFLERIELWKKNNNRIPDVAEAQLKGRVSQNKNVVKARLLGIV